MANLAEHGGITFVAFTAEPKNKTLELFSTWPDPTRASQLPTTCPSPFMWQAIEEGFILDVLQNHMPYSLAFKLAQVIKDC